MIDHFDGSDDGCINESLTEPGTNARLADTEGCDHRRQRPDESGAMPVRPAR